MEIVNDELARPRWPEGYYGRSPAMDTFEALRARMVERMAIPEHFFLGVDFADVEKRVAHLIMKEDDNMNATTNTAPAQPTNRAEQVLTTDLAARRRDRNYARGEQRKYEAVAKEHKKSADRHAAGVKEIETALKKAGFGIPEDVNPVK